LNGQAIHQLTRQAADLLVESEHALALTGAGISTPSGIPDFRSPRGGLWSKHDPMEVASITSFKYQPQRFFDWFHELAVTILAAEPNPAHEALARLERAAKLEAVVTQNVDGLHQRAGSINVCELHGHLREATCIACFHRTAVGDRLSTYATSGQPPRCDVCGGYLKPEVVLYGEQLPYEIVSRAQGYFADADLVMVGGSSLEVSPAAEMPYQALQSGAKLVIINLEPTYLDPRADIVIHADVAHVLPVLADEVLHVA
jgi:NAD-dependent deacetylase